MVQYFFPLNSYIVKILYFYEFMNDRYLITHAEQSSPSDSDLACTGRPHYNATLTAYYPDFSSDVESDYLDSRGKKLKNLQVFQKINWSWTRALFFNWYNLSLANKYSCIIVRDYSSLYNT